MIKKEQMNEGKLELIRLFKEEIEEKWITNRLKMLVEVSEELNYETLELTDITFSIENEKNYIDRWNVFTFHFIVNGEVMLINFFTDIEGNEYGRELAISDKYVLYEDEGPFPLISYHYMAEEDFPLQFKFLEVLNFIQIVDTFGEHLPDLFDLRNEYESGLNQEFYEEYKHILSGIVEVSDSMEEEISLTLESGIVVIGRKSEIIHQSNVLKNKFIVMK